MQFCNQCGQGNAEDSAFCVQCGATVEDPRQQARAPGPGTASQQTPPPQQQTYTYWAGAPYPGVVVPGTVLLSPGYPPSSAMPAQRHSGFAVASMVLGIVSIILYPLGLILGALGIIFWKYALDELTGDPAVRGDSFATTGLVCGIVGASVSAIFWIVVMIAAAT